MKLWDKTILAVLLKWDYGDPQRGPSGEDRIFYDNFKKLAKRVEVLWYDEYFRDMDHLQKVLVDKAKEVNPDLIFFVPFRHQITNDTYKHLKNNYCTCAWFGDDQWRFESFSGELAPYFSYVLTTDPYSVLKYKKIGIDPILTEWAGQTHTEFNELSFDDHLYRYDVSFIGAYNEMRGWFIKQLQKQGIKVECFGAGWPNGRITFEQMEQIFLRSKINLNISNSVNNDIRFIFGGPRNFARWIRTKKRFEQVKARNFEIPLAGGFQLSNYALGLERHWIIGQEIAVYNTPEECAQLIEYYLENEDSRRDITLKSYTRARNEHTYLHRLEKILEEIWG